MGRPKKPKAGKHLTIYLTPERLDRLGPDPRAAIYALIDGWEQPQLPSIPHVTDRISGPATPIGQGVGDIVDKTIRSIKSTPKDQVCPRHARMGACRHPVDIPHTSALAPTVPSKCGRESRND